MEGSYYYWLKRIREKSLQQLSVPKIETRLQEVSVEPAVFAKIKNPDKQASSDVIISINDMEIGLNRTTTPDLVQSVLLAVK